MRYPAEEKERAPAARPGDRENRANGATEGGFSGRTGEESAGTSGGLSEQLRKAVALLSQQVEQLQQQQQQ